MGLFTAIYRLLLRTASREFRDRYGGEAVEVALARVRAEPRGRDRWHQAGREIVDVARVCVRDRRAARFARRQQRSSGPSGARRGGTIVMRLGQDVRLAVRHTRRQPLPALLAVATLAVSIAAATTVFSVLSAVVWRPLPFADPDRLMLIRGTHEGRTLLEALSPENSCDWSSSSVSRLKAVRASARRDQECAPNLS